MSNIKLYTEEQMKRCFNDAQMQWANYNFMYRTWDEYIIACNPPPIELPIDDEICDEAESIAHNYFVMQRNHYQGLEEGAKRMAKWLLEQLKQQIE